MRDLVLHSIIIILNAIMNPTASWVGSIFGLIGAFIMATNSEYSYLGWWAFLCSNGFWIYHSVKENNMPILVMNLGFTVSSLLGIYRWIF
jgi:hypothetical protein